MEALIPTKIDPKTGTFVNVLGTPAFQFDAAFDSFLIEHENGCDNHTLMGRGTNFDETNAQPWRDRIAFHTHTKADDWKVSLKRLPPMAN